MHDPKRLRLLANEDRDYLDHGDMDEIMAALPALLDIAQAAHNTLHEAVIKTKDDGEHVESINVDPNLYVELMEALEPLYGVDDAEESEDAAPVGETPETVTPRRLSLVRFIGSTDDYPFNPDRTYIYLGDLANMPDHCAIADPFTDRIHSGYHTDNFVELTEEEV